MEMLPSLKILDANLLECNIPEDDYTQWVPGTYGLGDLVRDVGENKHRIYKSAVAGNAAVLTDKTKWTLVNTTNRHRMFDDSIASQSEYPNEIRFKVGGYTRITGLFLGNLDAQNVQVITRDADGVVRYDKKYSTVKKTGTLGWYKYFFGERVRVRDLYVSDIPYYFNQTIEVIISKPAGIAKCGVAVIGKRKVLGEVEMGFSFGFDDYSERTVEPTFGFTELFQRDYRKYNDLIVEVKKINADEVYEALADVRGTYCVFVGTKQLTSTQVYGFVETVKFLVNFQDVVQLQLGVKGIT